MEELNENNFLLYASKHYVNPACMTTEEFLEDLQRFKYIRKLFTRYLENNDLKERLILNHIIILYNVFGLEPCTNMILYKVEEYHYPILLPFLVYLNYIKYEGEFTNVPLDKIVIDKLRKL